MPKVRTKRAPLLSLFVALTVVCAGCASLPKDVHREPSHAWDRPQETALGRAIAPETERHPGMSGFLVLGNGMDAFVARMVLADVADRTLDLQYYIFHGDLTGKLLLDALLRAADRGVRVRLLVDDTAVKGKDAGVAALSAHPRIEVRSFNPAAGRSGAGWVFSSAAEFGRINHRMHNKLFVADNQAAVIGGRNIGDEYFGAQENKNFADMDLLAAGPVVQELSRTFDDFWNSEQVYPIEALHPEAVDPSSVERGRKELADHAQAARDSAYARRLQDSDLRRRLLARDLPFVWARAQVFGDRPEKAGGQQPADDVKMSPKLRPVAAAAASELIISSPYFIPGDDGLRFIGELRGRGVSVRIVTNSFAGNDVAVVHSGYSKYRTDLLKLGIELYELKASQGTSGADQKKFGSSEASLHAKTFIVDRERVFVGSFNLDPRSRDLNTELGVVVESREIAGILVRQFEQLVLPAHSHRLSLDGDGDIVWTSETDGKQVRAERDPDVGWWRRFSTWFLSIFAPESLL